MSAPFPHRDYDLGMADDKNGPWWGGHPKCVECDHNHAEISNNRIELVIAGETVYVAQESWGHCAACGTFDDLRYGHCMPCDDEGQYNWPVIRALEGNQ